MHSCFKKSLIRRCTALQTNFDGIDEIMKKNVFNLNEKYEKFDVRCLLKLLTTTNRVR